MQLCRPLQRHVEEHEAEPRFQLLGRKQKHGGGCWVGQWFSKLGSQQPPINWELVKDADSLGPTPDLPNQKF